MNTIHSLATMDWKGKVPPFEGKDSGNSLDNLKTILEIIRDNKDDDSKIILRKCIKFTKSIKDGKQYYLASSIYAKNYKVESETIEFQDGRDKVFNFQIKALERDYPGKDVKEVLKNLSKEDFQYLLQCLYSPPIKMSDDEKNQAVAFLRKHDLYNASRIQGTLGINPDANEHDYQKFELKDVLHFLSGDVKLNQDELTAVLRRATQFVEAMNPASREDLKAAVDISKAISQIDAKGNETSKQDPLKGLKNKLSKLANRQISESRNLNLFERFIGSLAEFLGKSVEHFLPIDQNFIYGNLSNISGLVIEAPLVPSESFWSWVSNNKENIDSIVFKKDFDIEDLKKVPDKMSFRIRN